MGKITLKGGIAAAALSACIAGGAFAAPAALLPGDTNVLNSGLNSAALPGGSVLASESIAFGAAPYYSGSLFSEVVAGDPNNPLGGLDFVYKITMDGTGKYDGINRFTIGNFAGVNTDAAYNHANFFEEQKNPTSVDRSAAADVIGFNFISPCSTPYGCPLGRGQISSTLILYTDTLQYSSASGSFLNGNITSDALTFTPGAPVTFAAAAAIPEPAAYAMVLAGLGLMGFMVRRRAKDVG